MIAELQTLEQPTGRQATPGHSEASARLYRSIPERTEYVPNPEYLSPGAEEALFGPEAPAVAVPLWRATMEVEEGQEEAQQPQTAPKLSRQDEALLFRRYNCARYHVSVLMAKQARRFARGRVGEILGWYRRALANRTALAEANMALVLAMARRTRMTSVEFGELVSEGNVVLLNAVDKFDYARGFKFSTYACCAILRAFSRLATRAVTYRRRFSANFEIEKASDHEVERRQADRHELALEDLQRVLVLNQAGLTDVERTVLGARFALPGHDRTHTLQEVSGLLQLSRERVRQVQHVAMAKLRQAMEPAPISAASWASPA